VPGKMRGAGNIDLQQRNSQFTGLQFKKQEHFPDFASYKDLSMGDSGGTLTIVVVSQKRYHCTTTFIWMQRSSILQCMFGLKMNLEKIPWFFIMSLVGTCKNID